MSRTLEEKVAYNQAQDSSFSDGYVVGVRFYQGYGKNGLSVEEKERRKNFVDDMRTGAKKHGYCKGFMCGFRDASKERKLKQKKK